MKKNLSMFFFLLLIVNFNAQTRNIWKKSSVTNKNTTIQQNKIALKNPNLYSLDFNKLIGALQNAPKRSEASGFSKTIISFPNSEGEFINYRVYENSNFDPLLQEKYPDIRAYIGESLLGNARIYFSVSPLGLSTMGLENGKPVEIIEPYTTDLSSYAVYKRTDNNGTPKEFECRIPNANIVSPNTGKPESADDGKLRTYRLALSCTGEYGAFFGGVSQALAGMNATMTRVNGVFENEFAIHMNLIPEENNIIFTNASTDPYSPASTGAGGAWNTELMNVLHGTTYGIGDSKFDIGHLFGRSGGGGSAGCIGCVCNNSVTYDNSAGWYWYKGQGFTSPGSGNPVGDDFDIDYVAHEMGHQFGGWHTFTFSTEGNPSQMEPGSGSTIMGYAGITSKDVQPHSDAYFHSASIRDVTTYIKSTSGNCSVNTNTGNTAPVVNAGANYTIPKSTPFMLTGSATDVNGDNLTYNWEQFDVQNNATTNPTATKTSGVNFRSYPSTTSPTRYFPTMASILLGRLYTVGSELNVEYLPSVARTLNFRLTVRDNRAGGAANTFGDMKVTVNAASGPFKVTSPNTAVTYPGGSTQTITWDVASTTASPVSCANVDILISTDGGVTWTTLVTSIPNNGTKAVVLPNVDTTTARIMVKANGNIFFDVSDANFTINKQSLAVTDVNKNAIQIYPNPATDVLNIKNTSANTTYEIHSVSGQLITKGELSTTHEINVRELIKGVYVITVINNGEVSKTKFIKK